MQSHKVCGGDSVNDNVMQACYIKYRKIHLQVQLLYSVRIACFGNSLEYSKVGTVRINGSRFLSLFEAFIWCSRIDKLRLRSREHFWYGAMSGHVGWVSWRSNKPALCHTVSGWLNHSYGRRTDPWFWAPGTGLSDLAPRVLGALMVPGVCISFVTELEPFTVQINATLTSVSTTVQNKTLKAPNKNI